MGMKLSEQIICRLESGRVLTRSELESWATAAEVLEGASGQLKELEEWGRGPNGVTICPGSDTAVTLCVIEGLRYATRGTLGEAIDAIGSGGPYGTTQCRDPLEHGD